MPQAIDYVGKRFDVYPDDDDAPLFYDWLEGESLRICGLELHLSGVHPAILSLRGKSYIRFAPYPQIYFRIVESSTGCGVEAFGGLWLLRSSDNEWLVVVDLETWLAPDDVSFLHKLFMKDS